MNLTPQQSAFVDTVVRQERNVALIARAGSGKTSTILAAVDALRATLARRSPSRCAPTTRRSKSRSAPSSSATATPTGR